MEDILEEIIGEIQDEFDADESPMIEKRTPKLTVLDGKVLISEVNDMFGLHIDDSDLDTIGGWLLSQAVDLNIEAGYSIEYAGFQFKALELDGHQIKKIAVHKLDIKRSYKVTVFLTICIIACFIISFLAFIYPYYPRYLSCMGWIFDLPFWYKWRGTNNYFLGHSSHFQLYSFSSLILLLMDIS